MNSEALINRLAQSQQSAANTAPQPRKRLLLADDSPQIRESLSKLLRIAGYHVSLVANGAQALDRAVEEEFDLLLLDLNMPGVDGWETLEHLAALKPRLPVLVITAQAHQEEWAVAGGAKALMEKPLDPAMLLKTVGELLSRKPVEAKADASERFAFRRAEKRATPFFHDRRRWAQD